MTGGWDWAPEPVCCGRCGSGTFEGGLVNGPLRYGLVCPSCSVELALYEAGYHRQRVSADWIVAAWRIPGTDLYWTDDEDGNWSLVFRPDLDQDEVVLSTWDWSEVTIYISTCGDAIRGDD